MTFKEYYKDIASRGLIKTDPQGQKDIETWAEIQLQKARDQADRILYLCKIVAQSYPLVAHIDAMLFDCLPDYDGLCYTKHLTKFNTGGN